MILLISPEYVLWPMREKKLKPTAILLNENLNEAGNSLYFQWYIVHNLLTKAALSKTSAHFDTPTIVYILTNEVGSKIFNFNKFVNNLNGKAFLDDNSTLSCECTISQSVDKDHNHNIRGNLKIIFNNKLWKLFSKCPKY